MASILDYMVRRGQSPGPFFLWVNGNGLTRDRFVTAVRAALDQAGVNSSLYAGHSFRIGAATTAAQRGIPDSLIKTLGRWQSAAYTVYIRTPHETYAQWRDPWSSQHQYRTAASMLCEGDPCLTFMFLTFLYGTVLVIVFYAVSGCYNIVFS